MTRYLNTMLIALIMTLFTGSLTSQSDACTPFFVFKEGTHWTMEAFNKKDKFENRITYKIIRVDHSGPKVTAQVSSTMYDKKEKLLFEMDYEVSCTDGVYSVDLSSVLSPAITRGFQGMEMEIEGQELTLPPDLEKGQELADANTEITVRSSGIQLMSTRVEMSDRKVTDQTAMTVPAGSFDCFEIKSQQAVKAGFVNKEYEVVDYYSPGVGMVRTETYDKKGKLDSYMVLTEFEAGS